MRSYKQVSGVFGQPRARYVDRRTYRHSLAYALSSNDPGKVGLKAERGGVPPNEKNGSSFS